MNDQVAQKIADRLNELAGDFADHARQIIEDISPAGRELLKATAAEATARGERVRSLEEQQATILRIVADWCTEYYDIGGIDAGDLAWRLRQAGHPLPTGKDTDQ